MSEIPADILETTNKLVNHYVNPYEPRPDCRPDFRPYLRKLIAEALAAERQRDRWQPIETAPKDGTYIILAHFGDDGVEVIGGDWNLYPKPGQEGLHGFRAWIEDPTHWMPVVPPKPHHFNQEGK